MSANALVVEAQAIDVFNDSQEYLLGVSFPKSRGASYEAAINIARQTPKYSEMEIGGTMFHYVVFDRNKEDAVRALLIVRYLKKQKGLQIYARGKTVLYPYTVEHVLECYLKSLACNDWKAHCFKVIESPYKLEDFDADSAIVFKINMDGILPGRTSQPATQYIFPCAFAYSWNRRALFSKHPSSVQDQIQAKAIDCGCDWCPKFDQRNFEKLS